MRSDTRYRPRVSRFVRPCRTPVLVLAATAALLLAASIASADPRPRPPLDAAAIRLGLERLEVMGTVLHVAAHPDDENTALLSWLASGRKVRTGYLSITRGDGGQNLIGGETGELLGVIRTQELLSARRVDGAEQFFTRAVDFGFSKNPDETLAIWERERILADVVYVIRRFRPDVIITRFPTDSAAGGHGHHTASAILAEEAFAAAADPKRFPEQLATTKPWAAKRVVWNVFRFGAAGPDTSRDRARADVGEYSPLLGRSFSEIAGESRSMHKSQGFGAPERRGTFVNTFVHKHGTPGPRDLFEGVDLSWSRVPGGAKVGALVKKARTAFDPDRPHLIVPALLEAHRAMAALPDEPLVARKREETLELVRACAGLWLEAVALAPSASPGTTARVVTTAIGRSPVAIAIERVEIVPLGAARDSARTLALNVLASDTLRVQIPADFPVSQPYWLAGRPSRGAFVTGAQDLAGTPENRAALHARFTLRLAGERLVYETPVVYRWTDRVQGERYRDFVVAPPLTMRFDEGAYLFSGGAARPVQVVVEGGDAPVSGTLRLELPAGWNSSPAEIPVRLARAEAETTVRFLVTPGPSPAAAEARAVFAAAGSTWDRARVRIDYPHIPLQTLFPPAAAKLVRTDVALAAKRIGYLAGSGDDVPAALRQMGAEVTLLEDDAVENGDLDRFDAIVAGVRAYNTRPRLRALQPKLLGYVERGGRLVIQYNTNETALDDRLGPYPFKISRERVTVEEAPVTFVTPEHPLLHTPNKIGPADFEGWVQERGLYFAQPVDPRYQRVLACNDPGEPSREGGLIYARHGRGAFVYTGFAWFRQLPGGVPGAWRLFANIVSAPREQQ